MGSIARRAERARQIVAKYGSSDDGNDFDPDGLFEFVVVEKSRHSGAIWYTPVDSLAEATAAVDSQEYPEDWECVAVVSAETGETFVPRVTTSWELADGIAAIALPGDLAPEPNPAGIIR